MMPLEHQVTSLEISQRLQELGTKQNSLFSWFPRGTIEVHPFIALSSSQNNSLCSAYTVAELVSLCGKQFLLLKQNISETKDKQWEAGSYWKKVTNQCYGETAIEALGKLTIKLYEDSKI